jgi:hypothetical protein
MLVQDPIRGAVIRHTFCSPHQSNSLTIREVIFASVVFFVMHLSRKEEGKDALPGLLFRTAEASLCKNCVTG